MVNCIGRTSFLTGRIVSSGLITLSPSINGPSHLHGTLESLESVIAGEPPGPSALIAGAPLVQHTSCECFVVVERLIAQDPRYFKSTL